MEINLKHNSNISACSIFYSSLSDQTGKNISNISHPEKSLSSAQLSSGVLPCADFCAIQEGTFWPTYWKFFLLSCYKCHLELYLLSQLWWLEQDKLSKEECLLPKWFTKMNTSSSTNTSCGFSVGTLICDVLHFAKQIKKNILIKMNF